MLILNNFFDLKACPRFESRNDPAIIVLVEPDIDEALRLISDVMKLNSQPVLLPFAEQQPRRNQEARLVATVRGSFVDNLVDLAVWDDRIRRLLDTVLLVGKG